MEKQNIEKYPYVLKDYNMNREKHLINLFEALNDGRISLEAYDAGVANINAFYEREDVNEN